jgi:diguanylate cyclase (GGDEF)-like protein/PAS domain S-box-containing protein
VLRLAALLDSLPIAFVAHDVNGRVLAWNPAAEALLGWRRDEVLGRRSPLPEALTHSPLPASKSQVPRVHVATRAGGLIEVAVATLPASGGDGAAVCLWVPEPASTVDATKLETERRLFERVFQTSGEAIIITDAKNEIIAVNDAFSRITGYVLDEVQGKNPRVLSSGKHDELFYAAMWHALSTVGTWRGELWNRRKNGEVYCEWATINVVRSPSGEPTHYVAIFADITEAKDSMAQVTYLAQHDHLTGLPNRSLLRDRLAQAISSAQRTGHLAAMLVLDLDGFKSINGSLGPYEGDSLLMEMAYRLKDAVRSGDTVARMGGDEFGVVLNDLASTQECVALVERIRTAISEPVTVAGQELRVTASIGVSVFPQDGTSTNVLLSNSDAAMHSAKEGGRDTSRFFTESMNSRAQERLVLTTGLGRALERGEFRIQYQPQRPIVGDHLLGVEALIRWHHPDLGLVSPDRFIHLAEETGSIRNIGAWVLHEAALCAKRWNIVVSVNLSVVQLQDPHFFERVTEVLQETKVDPSLLEFEVTESVVMKDPSAAVELLSRIRSLGVHLAMDDFGTGYSSLSQLKRLPLDRLKIDRAFVRDVMNDPADQAVVQAVIAMGHALKLRIIAEGVESQEQRTMLESFGCDEVQGYLCGKPVDPELIDKEQRN